MTTLPAMDPNMFAYASAAHQATSTPYPNAAATELYTQMLMAAAAAQQQHQPLDAAAVAAAAAGMSAAYASMAGGVPAAAAPDATAVMTMNAAAILAAHALSTTSPLWSSANTSPSALSPFTSAAAAHHNGGGYSSGGFAPQGSFGMSSSAAAAAPTHVAAAAPAPKRYSHNPYASDPSTPTTPMLGASFSGSNLSSSSLMHHHQQQQQSIHVGVAAASQQQQHMMNPEALMLGSAAGLGSFGGMHQLHHPQLQAVSSIGHHAAAASDMHHGHHHHHVGAPGSTASGAAAGGSSQQSVADQFAQIKGNLAAAACTSRGRHVIIGALRLQHADKLQAVLDEIVPAFATVVADANGSHVIRTLFEFLSDEQSAALLMALNAEAILALATSSQHSRRVLQSALERHRNTAATTLQGVVDVVSANALALAVGQQGCIAVMRVVENCTDAQKKQILQAVRPELASLTTDPYGNYVVQTLIQNLPRDVASDVIDKAFEGQFVTMCCNKFASNVMEKIVNAANPPTRKMILDEICFNTASLTMVMQDGFGNFVLQAIIDTCTAGCEYRKLCDRIRPLLTCSPYGHKIEAKLRSKRFNNANASH